MDTVRTEKRGRLDSASRPSSPVAQMVIDAKVLGARLQHGEFAEDRMPLRVKLGQTLKRLHDVGIHRQSGYPRWRAWCDAELPFTGRMADRYIRVADEWERGARGSSLREIAGEAPTERISVGEVTTRVLTDDSFVVSLVNDDDAWQRLASIRDMMKRKQNRPPSKPTPVVTDLQRARKALYLATKKVERLNARALAGQVEIDRELADKLRRAMEEITNNYDMLDDAVRSLAATSTGLWR